jgi:hypothetical protein
LPPERRILEDVPLRDVTPLVPTTALVANNLRDGQVTRRDGFSEPAFANMSFCQYISKIKAELELIESSSEEESEPERDLPIGPMGLVMDGPGQYMTRDLTRLADTKGRSVRSETECGEVILATDSDRWDCENVAGCSKHQFGPKAFRFQQSQKMKG